MQVDTACIQAKDCHPGSFPLFRSLFTHYCHTTGVLMVDMDTPPRSSLQGSTRSKDQCAHSQLQNKADTSKLHLNADTDHCTEATARLRDRTDWESPLLRFDARNSSCCVKDNTEMKCISSGKDSGRLPPRGLDLRDEYHNCTELCAGIQLCQHAVPSARSKGPHKTG